MRYTGRWPLLPIAGGSGDDEPPPPLTPALARELEELRAFRTQTEPALVKELDELRTFRTQTEPELTARGQRIAELETRHAEVDNQLAALAAERDAARQAHLQAHRARLLAEHPDIVAELVQGDSVDALNGSLAHAQAAHKRIAEQVAERTRATAAGTYVAAGTPPRQPPQPPEGVTGPARITWALENQPRA
jgi:hypothetical protein